jgi:hypothetical protein
MRQWIATHVDNKDTQFQGESEKSTWKEILDDIRLDLLGKVKLKEIDKSDRFEVEIFGKAGNDEYTLKEGKWTILPKNPKAAKPSRADKVTEKPARKSAIATTTVRKTVPDSVPRRRRKTAEQTA